MKTLLALPLALTLTTALAGTLPLQENADPTPRPVSAATPAPTILFVVRHAETTGSTRTEPDPPLSAEGEARAEALARLLGEAGATHLFCTTLQRTGATLAPLATAAELEPRALAPQDTAALVEELRALPSGAVAVVAGHSNTVPAVVEGLGGVIPGLERDPRHGPLLGHDQYDRLFQVVLPATDASAVRTVEFRYGDA